MAFEVDLEELQKQELLDANRILNEFFTKNNINLKTQIDAPSEFTTLDTIQKHFNELINLHSGKKMKHRFKEPQKILGHWLDRFKEYMVSYARISRQEVSKVLIALKEQEQTSRGILERLTGLGKEK